MFGTGLARIGAVIFGAGMLLLAISFLLWQRERPGFWDEYSRTEWVRSDQSDQPAVAEDEIWRFSQVCYRPYISAELVEARARFETNQQSMPTEIRSYRDRRESSNESDYKRVEEWARLAEKYRKWRIEEDWLDGIVKCWEERLDFVGEKDIELVKSELPQFVQGNPQDVFLRDGNRLPTGHGSCAHSEVTEGEIISGCLQRIKMKSIVTNTTYASRLPKWPERQPYLFWPSISLILAGIVFVPIASWVRSAPK